MFADKIKLTDAYLNLIIQKRKEHAFTAYQLSEHIGKNKSWLPNIENHRTKNITKEEFLLIFHDFAKEENMDTETYIINYLPSDALIELEDNTLVPCYYLKIKLNLLSPETQLNIPHLSLETPSTEFNQQPDKLTQLIQYLSNLNKTIQHTFFTMPEQEKQHTLDMLLTMNQNFSYHFNITRSLYEIPLYEFPLFEEPYYSDKILPHNDPKTCSDKDNLYSASPNEANHNRISSSDPIEIENNHFSTPLIEDFSNLIKNFSISISLLNTKAKIYHFFDTSSSTNTLFNKINNYQYGDLQELTEILFDIETYIYTLYDYITLSYKNPELDNCKSPLNYQELYDKMLQFINDFLRIAEITYSFDFHLPSLHPTKEELEKKHLEITNILFQIRKLFYNKYNNNHTINTKDTINQSKIRTDNVSSDKIKKEKNLKFQKTKEQKYLKLQKMQKIKKMQKMQKFQDETAPIPNQSHESKPNPEHEPTSVYKPKLNKDIIKNKNIIKNTQN